MKHDKTFYTLKLGDESVGDAILAGTYKTLASAKKEYKSFYTLYGESSGKPVLGQFGVYSKARVLTNII